MFYEVRARLYFDIEDEATDFYHDCELALSKATVINPISDNLEFSVVEVIENHHDEDPNASCSLLTQVNNRPI